MPLHECFHVPVTSCQRAEVKRVLHCDATARADMNVFSSDTFYCRDIFTPTTTNLQIPLLRTHHFFFINFSSFIFLTYHKYNIFDVVFPAFSKYKFVVVEEKIYRQQEVFLTEERSYPHLLLHRSAGLALPQPVDNL